MPNGGPIGPTTGSATYPLYPSYPPPAAPPGPTVPNIIHSQADLKIDPEFLTVMKRIAVALETIVEKMGEGFA